MSADSWGKLQRCFCSHFTSILLVYELTKILISQVLILSQKFFTCEGDETGGVPSDTSM